MTTHGSSYHLHKIQIAVFAPPSAGTHFHAFDNDSVRGFGREVVREC
jgi:hypothetical protein